jgi:four helix bundle protein
MTPNPRREPHPHERLDAWKEAIQLVKVIFTLTTSLPVEQRYGLTSQAQRAAVSIPANIAEGSARGTAAEMRRFYMIARGSAAELDTLIILVEELGFAGKKETDAVREKINRVNLLLNGLIRFHDAKLKEDRSRAR